MRELEKKVLFGPISPKKPPDNLVHCVARPALIDAYFFHFSNVKSQKEVNSAIARCVRENWKESAAQLVMHLNARLIPVYLSSLTRGHGRRMYVNRVSKIVAEKVNLMRICPQYYCGPHIWWLAKQWKVLRTTNGAAAVKALRNAQEPSEFNKAVESLFPTFIPSPTGYYIARSPAAANPLLKSSGEVVSTATEQFPPVWRIGPYVDFRFAKDFTLEHLSNIRSVRLKEFLGESQHMSREEISAIKDRLLSMSLQQMEMQRQRRRETKHK